MGENLPTFWWDLHLRKARGEKLSKEELGQYHAEQTRQDKESLPPHDLESLKKLRTQVANLALENIQLRTRLQALEEEIHRLERSLSQPTRQLLGVPE